METKEIIISLIFFILVYCYTRITLYKLNSCKNSIKEILATGSLRFSLDDDAADANQAPVKKGIYYYWVPMSILP